VKIRFPYSPERVSAIRQIPGRRWLNSEKAWEVPDTELSVILLQQLGFGTFRSPIGFPSLSVGAEWQSPIPPYRHQRVMTNLISGCIASSIGYCIFAETGVGKTKAVIDTIRQGISPCLIVCPAPLLNVWQREAESHGLTLNVAHGRGRCYRGSIDLTSYDTLAIDVQSNAPMPEYRAIFLDESQLVKSHVSKRHKAIYKMPCSSKFILTGTPYGQSWRDVWAQTRLVCPHLIGSSKVFYDHFCDFGTYGEITGYRNLDLFKSLVAKISISIRKADCLDLPPKTFQTVQLDMGQEQARVYKRLKAGAFKDEPISSVLSRIGLMRQCSSGFVYTGDGEPRPRDQFPDPKTEYLASISWDTPTIIWASFTGEVDKITATLTSIGVSYVIADGKHPADKAVEAFNTGDIQVLVANYASVQYGFTVNRAARAIFYSPPLSQLQYSQAQDRNHRIGQHNPVLYISLIATPIEKYILKLLASHVTIKDHLLELFKRQDLSEI
jgi:SNF2 family DNA or RNA helicase